MKTQGFLLAGRVARRRGRAQASNPRLDQCQFWSLMPGADQTRPSQLSWHHQWALAPMLLSIGACGCLGLEWARGCGMDGLADGQR